MRHHRATTSENAFSILTLDDDPIMTSTLQAYFQRSGYRVDAENDPMKAIERIRTGSYDILLLDFLMTPICGDQVVEEIRKFDKNLYIILLTGHKTMAPPIHTIRALDIQGYYEKSDRFDQLELLVESCVKSIRQTRTIQGYQHGLAAIVESLPEIYHLQDLDGILDGILHIMTTVLTCKGAMLMLDAARCGLPQEPPRILRSTGLPFPAVDEDEAADKLKDLAEKGSQTIDNLAFFPLFNGKKAIGYLGARYAMHPEYSQIQLMEVLSKQASAAISNALLHALVQEKSDELDQAYRRLRDNYAEIIAIVRGIVDAKDYYTRNHSDRVSFYAVELARHLGKSDAYCERLRVAGTFHDIGKLGISDGILLKESRLTDEEYAVIKTHPARGAELLSYISYFKDIVPWIRAHHERYDGKGYPDGLAGDAIPEQARIISVADSFDAMTSDRRYRKSLGVKQAVAELEAGRGTQFDPVFADAFIDLLESPDFIQRVAKMDEDENA